MSTLAPDAPTATFRAAMDAKDLDAVIACMAPDAVVHSPITDLFAFRGTAQLTDLFADVFAVVEDLTYVEDVGDDLTRVLRAKGRVGGVALEESLVVQLDVEGRIVEQTVFIRPMPALTALAAALGPRVARRKGRARAAVVTGLMAPLAFMTRSGEGVGARLARP